MKLRIEIDTDNDAFADSENYEIGRILRKYVEKIERDGIGDHPIRLSDINGNTVGFAGAVTSNIVRMHDA